MLLCDQPYHLMARISPGPGMKRRGKEQGEQQRGEGTAAKAWGHVGGSA